VSALPPGLPKRSQSRLTAAACQHTPIMQPPLCISSVFGPGRPMAVYGAQPAALSSVVCISVRPTTSWNT
jgi:hypothetical protein